MSINRNFEVVATGPGGEIIRTIYSEIDLREQIAGSIARGINASCEIEGEGLPHPIYINPDTISEALLKTS